MAKGCDHETVMALETHPHDISWKIKLNLVWSRAFKCGVKTYMAGLSTECYVIIILFMRALEG